MQRAIRAAVHGEGRPWYARSPGKEILAHVASVATAVGLSLAVHRFTGEPVTVEATSAPVIEPTGVDPLSEKLAEVDIVYEALDAAATPVAAAAPRAKGATAPAPAAAAPAAAPPAAIDGVLGGAR
jgi:hypothetical protein